MILFISFIKCIDLFEFCSEWHQVENDCLKALDLDNSLTKVCVVMICKVYASVVVPSSVAIVVHAFDHDALVTLY